MPCDNVKFRHESWFWTTYTIFRWNIMRLPLENYCFIIFTVLTDVFKTICDVMKVLNTLMALSEGLAITWKLRARAHFELILPHFLGISWGYLMSYCFIIFAVLSDVFKLYVMSWEYLIYFWTSLEGLR